MRTTPCRNYRVAGVVLVISAGGVADFGVAPPGPADARESWVTRPSRMSTGSVDVSDGPIETSRPSRASAARDGAPPILDRGACDPGDSPSGLVSLT